MTDLILPSDVSTQLPLSITLKSLCLSPTPLPEPKAAGVLPNELRTFNNRELTLTYSAIMNYKWNIEGEKATDINIPIRYDVSFVTAHPCIVPMQTEHSVPMTSSTTREAIVPLGILVRSL